MKQISALFVLFILLFTSCNNGQSSSAGNLNWNDNLEKAVEQAKKENKAVLVNFTGSDWCIWCKRLSAEVFQQKEFEEYAKKSLVLVMLDFPKDSRGQTKPRATQANTLLQNLPNRVGRQSR